MVGVGPGPARQPKRSAEDREKGEIHARAPNFCIRSPFFSFIASEFRYLVFTQAKKEGETSKFLVCFFNPSCVITLAAESCLTTSSKLRLYNTRIGQFLGLKYPNSRTPIIRNLPDPPSQLEVIASYQTASDHHRRQPGAHQKLNLTIYAWGFYQKGGFLNSFINAM